MGPFFDRFPYLATALMVLGIFAVGLVAFPRARASALRSATLALPAGLWGLFLVPEYWTPRLIVRVGRLGPEDFIWAFATGGLAWLFAAAPAGPRLAERQAWSVSILRLVASTAIGDIVFFSLWLVGRPVIEASFCGMAAPAVFLLWRCAQGWRLGARAGVGLGLTNLLVMKVNLLLHPAYYAQMAPGALGGATFWGLPIEELCWAFAAAVSWPMIAVYVLGPQERRGLAERGAVSSGQATPGGRS